MRETTSWTLIALALIAGGCAERSVSDGGQAQNEQAVQSESQEHHVRLLISYENGKFAIEKRWDVPLKLARVRGRIQGGRDSLRYVTRGQGPSEGLIRDPRATHAEVADPSGKLEQVEYKPEGKQYFTVNVPAGATQIDFFEAAPEVEPPAGREASPVVSLDLSTESGVKP